MIIIENILQFCVYRTYTAKSNPHPFTISIKQLHPYKLSERITPVKISNPILILRFLVIFIQQFKQSLESYPQKGASSIRSEKSLIFWEDFPEMLVTRWIECDAMEV